MDSKRIGTMASVVIALLLLIYVCFNVVNGQSNSAVTTEIALYGEVSDTLQAQGFAVREEDVITPSYQGVLNFRVASGARVSKGGVIADVFHSESDAAAQNIADRLDREIQSLSPLAQPIDYFVSASVSTGDQIYDSLGRILVNVQRNKFTSVVVPKEDLLSSLSRKQVISGEESAEDYAQRVEELEEEKMQLTAGTAQAVDRVEAPGSGYFVGSTDGFENVIGVDDILGITPEEVENLLALQQGTGTQSSVGKICSNFKWYLVCVLDEDDMMKFEGVEDVSLDIPFASTETIPAKVAAKNRDIKTGKTAVVLECSYMDADIATVRNETVQINVKKYSGVLVNERALRFCDVEYTEVDETGNSVTKVRENVKGVYVVFGGQLKFVQVFTEKDVNGYAVCKTELSDGEEKNLVTDRTVQLYDKVVVGGVNLYDGKIIQ
ncbi:HlyD family efflux transporter periplasmic adaptor subunit [Acutalibacter sp. 1XD8-33]|uniref:HlyD family efflux transporter periplasmic adaptor subunit n=1 Tax=Acutalibacter sp. 1XD8-33 TaxID=2320081 RepID=UPI0011C39B3D|nr:HlyD family efflux transporter periplasmic adaptor subunit [Acutalibacter sp. 1XD8-33]